MSSPSNVMNNNIPFFQEVYANYNQIWQQVLKLTLINNSLVDYKSFVRILKKSGIETDNAYCQFLLKTCFKLEQFHKEDGARNQKYQNFMVKSTPKNNNAEPLIDYKLFLNSAIKALSQESFDNETFIIEQFWKTKFGDNHSHRQVTIEDFNEGFYQFFNRDSKLLSIDYIEQILNECFAYLLRKNKKVISKRSFKKVIRRYFRDIFNLIFFSFQNKSASIDDFSSIKKSLPLTNATAGNNRILLPRDESLGGYIQTTYYPDSLDTRSQYLQLNQHRFSKQGVLITQNSRSFFNETSTFHNPLTSHNSRSKSSELLTMKGGRGIISSSIDNHHNSSSSNYDLLAQNVGLLLNTEKKTHNINNNNTINVKTQGCRLMVYTIDKLSNAIRNRMAFQKLKRFTKRAIKKEKLASRNNNTRVEKENLVPQLTTQDSLQNQDQISQNQKESTMLKENMFSATLGATNKRRPLQERETFSFNNINQIQDLRDANIDQAYEKYQTSQSRYERNLNYQYLNEINEKRQQDLIQIPYHDQQHYNSVNQRFNSQGSLQYSNTPSHSIYNPVLLSQDNFYISKDMPISTKSQSQYPNKVNLNPKLKCETQRRELFSVDQSDIQKQVIVSDLNRECNTTNDFSLRELEQKLDDIKSQNTYSTNKSSRRFSLNNPSRPLNYAQPNQTLNRQSYPVQEIIKPNHVQHYLHQDNQLFTQHPSYMVRSLDRSHPQQLQPNNRISYPTNQENIQYLPQYQSSLNHQYETTQGQIDKTSFITCDITPISPLKTNITPDQKINTTHLNDYSTLSKIDTVNIQSSSKNNNDFNTVQLSNHHNHQQYPQTNQHQQNHQQRHYRKPKELVYFEKKYKKSKEKMRTLINDNVNEKTKNQALTQCNFVLGEKVEALEQEKDILQEDLRTNLEGNSQLQEQLRIFEVQVAFKQLFKIQYRKTCQTLRKSITLWKSYCSLVNNKHFNIKKQESLKNYKSLNKFFHNWVKYAIHRKTRKERRKLYKLQCKVMKMIVRKRILMKKRRAFNQWKGNFILNEMMIEVQKDIHFAHEQMKIMRIVLGLNKIKTLIDRKQLVKRLQVFNLLNKIINKQSFNSSLKRTQQSVDKYYQRQSLLSPMRRDLEKIPISGRMSETVKQEKFDYSLKVNKQRQQANIIEGLELIYHIMKKQTVKSKGLYLNKWRTVINENSYDEGPKQYLYSPKQIYNDFSGDLDLLQDYQPLPQHHQHHSSNTHSTALSAQPYFTSQLHTQTHSLLQDPCYYKTNEGFFYPQQPQPIIQQQQQKLQHQYISPMKFQIDTKCDEQYEQFITHSIWIITQTLSTHQSTNT